MTNKCIVCQTNPINSMIGKSFCSQLCKSLYLRLDLQWVDLNTLKNIALAQHEMLKDADWQQDNCDEYRWHR